MALAFSFLHTPDVNKHVAYSRQVRTIMSATILSQQPLWHPCLHLVPTNIRKRSSIESTARRGGWNASSLPLASPVETVESTSSALWRGIRLLELKNEFILKHHFICAKVLPRHFCFSPVEDGKLMVSLQDLLKWIFVFFLGKVPFLCVNGSLWVRKKVLHLSIYLFMGFHI